IDDTNAVLEAELYSPQTNAWQTLEAATVVRNYHSVALLMPDGRVWTAGSSIDGQHTGQWRREIEVYSPWDCYRSDRPSVDKVLHGIAPGSGGILYSHHVDISTPQAVDIRRVFVIRAGSVTHAFSSDQRCMGLEFELVDPSTIRAVLPSSGV